MYLTHILLDLYLFHVFCAVVKNFIGVVVQEILLLHISVSIVLSFCTFNSVILLNSLVSSSSFVAFFGFFFNVDNNVLCKS